jgi:transposase
METKSKIIKFDICLGSTISHANSTIMVTALSRFPKTLCLLYHVDHPRTATQMAPNLASSTREFIHDMIMINELTTSQMAEAAGCHPSTIRRLRSNMCLFGSVKAPPNKGGRPRSLTPVMIKVLCDHLLEKPHLYLDEMAIFLWDEFQVQVTTCNISRALKSEGWSKKTAKQKAKERNADLRDAYFHFISDFCSYHLVYVDESGCDKRIGFRRTGWSPLGITPSQVTKFHRDQRYQILPAYAQDGVILSRVFQGSNDASVFEDFIEELVIVENGQNQNLFLLWTTPPFTTPRE